MLVFLSVVFVIYFVAIVFSPFPYWPTYRLLWRYLLLKKQSDIGVQARLRQAKFLIKPLAFDPFSTLFWYIDEIFYSAYRKREVDPVFILGQPRSGTTFLHRTLAEDDKNFVAIKHIEWRYPYLCVQKLIARFDWIQGLLGGNYWPDTEEGRKASRMHPNSLSDWEEDGIFFEEAFLHHFFIFLRFPFPDLLDKVDDFEGLPEKDQKRILLAHKKVIQKILYLRGLNGQRYLSKEVTSHNKIEQIIKLYPNARFVISARHSGDFMNSLLKLVRYSTMSKIGVDPQLIPGWEKVFVERMYNDSLQLVDLVTNHISQDRQVKVAFRHFTGNVLGEVERIYRDLGLDLSVEYETYLVDLCARQKNRDRGYSYQKKPYAGFEVFDQFVNDAIENRELNLDEPCS